MKVEIKYKDLDGNIKIVYTDTSNLIEINQEDNTSVTTIKVSAPEASTTTRWIGGRPVRK